MGRERKVGGLVERGKRRREDKWNGRIREPMKEDGKPGVRTNSLHFAIICSFNDG